MPLVYWTGFFERYSTHRVYTPSLTPLFLINEIMENHIQITPLQKANQTLSKFISLDNPLKQALLFIILLGFNLSSFGQTQGKITYKEVWERKFRNWSFTEDHTWEIIFNDTIAVCRWIKPKEDNNEQRPRWMRDLTDVYVTYPQNNEVHDAVNFMQRNFILKGSPATMKWRMTGKQGMVESYPAMEARSIEGKDTILAWFTPVVPLSIGPREFRGLPGAIIYLEQDAGRRKITIENLDLQYVPKESDFKVDFPKGEKSSYEDFIKLRIEKTAELREMYGG